MKKQLKQLISALLLIPAFVLGLSLFVPVAVSAATNCTDDLSVANGANCAKGNDQPDELFSETGLFKKVTDILLFITGAIAVIMLIIGGIRYVVSGGDQNAVTSAKNTILYAIVGIVVVFLAYAAVNFVATQISAP